MEIIVRKAKSEDLTSVQKIYNNIIAHEEHNVKYTAFQANVYPVMETAEKALADNSLYVCVKDGEICASIIINQLQPDEYKNIDWKYKFSANEIMVIHLLCVSPAHSGKGLGRKMIEFAVAEGKKRNCKAIRLDTGNQNIPAKSLYEKNGFTVAGMGSMSVGGLIRHSNHLFYEKNLTEKLTISNPWKSIKLSDYENHMKSDNVMQLQTLNSMMKEQLNTYSVDNVMILGVAGGNGLEHIKTEKYNTVYGIDINSEYLYEAENRYRNLDGIIKYLCIDLISETDKLPSCDFIIANLLIEYIGYECFQKVVKQVKPEYISCGIQVNTGKAFVSDSPYIHSFECLDSVHHQIQTDGLVKSMNNIGYMLLSLKEYPLPDGKKLVQENFTHK